MIMTKNRKCSLICKTLSLSVFAVFLSGAAVIAQRTDAGVEGDKALLALKAELEEAGRVWVSSYRQATSDQERAELQKNSPHRTFEPRFLALARNYAGQPAAMEAVQWLAETANPGQFFDEGLALVEQPTIYLIDGEGCIKHQGLRDDPLDDAVAAMLGISPESRVKVDKRTRVWDLSLRSMNLSGKELPSRLEGYTELRNLDLSHNPLSVEALAHLRPLQKLESINLQHTGITDQGLQHLEQLPNLKQVHLYRGPGHRTTEEGRRKLREAIPGLTMPFITH